MPALLEQSHATVLPQQVDAEGIVVDKEFDGCDLVYVTLSHQIPTAVTMSLDCRQAFVAAARDNHFLISISPAFGD